MACMVSLVPGTSCAGEVGFGWKVTSTRGAKEFQVDQVAGVVRREKATEAGAEMVMCAGEARMVVG